MENEKPKRQFYSRYKNNSDEIKNQIESGYRWEKDALPDYFNQNTYTKLSKSLTWTTWTELGKILDQITFYTTTESLFKKEVSDYIKQKTKLFNEAKRKGVK